MSSDTPHYESESPDVQVVLLNGLISIAIVLAIATLCIAPFEPHFFTEWVSLAFMAATPTQILIGLLWHNEKPSFVLRFDQPMRAIASDHNSGGSAVFSTDD